MICTYCNREIVGVHSCAERAAIQRARVNLALESIAKKRDAARAHTLRILASEAHPDSPAARLAGVQAVPGRPAKLRRAKATLRPVVASPRPVPPEGSIGWQIQARTPNPSNAGHGVADSREADGRRRARLRSLARDVTIAAIVRAGLRSGELTMCTVLVRRVAPSSGLDPHDGLMTALKPIVDGIADALGLTSDRSPLVVWEYEQRRGSKGEHAVDIEWRRQP